MNLLEFLFVELKTFFRHQFWEWLAIFVKNLSCKTLHHWSAHKNLLKIQSSFLMSTSIQNNMIRAKFSAFAYLWSWSDWSSHSKNRQEFHFYVTLGKIHHVTNNKQPICLKTLESDIFQLLVIIAMHVIPCVNFVAWQLFIRKNALKISRPSKSANSITKLAKMWLSQPLVCDVRDNQKIMTLYCRWCLRENHAQIQLHVVKCTNSEQTVYNYSWQLGICWTTNLCERMIKYEIIL